MAVFTDDEIDRMNEERRKKKHGKIVSAYYRMKEHPAYKVWIGRLECLAAVFMVIAALGMTVFYVSIAYDYFHPDHDRLSAEDAVVCSGNLVDITDESYISRYGINHFIFDFKLDNGQVLELEDELYLLYERNLTDQKSGGTDSVEYDDDIFLEAITCWLDGLEPGDTLTYTVKKNAQNRKYPEIYSLSVNGEELVSPDQINAVKYEQNLFFADIWVWGLLLIAVLAMWFGAYYFVTEYIRNRKKRKISPDQESACLEKVREAAEPDDDSISLKGKSLIIFLVSTVIVLVPAGVIGISGFNTITMADVISESMEENSEVPANEQGGKEEAFTGASEGSFRFLDVKGITEGAFVIDSALPDILSRYRFVQSEDGSCSLIYIDSFTMGLLKDNYDYMLYNDMQDVDTVTVHGYTVKTDYAVMEEMIGLWNAVGNGEPVSDAEEFRKRFGTCFLYVFPYRTDNLEDMKNGGWMAVGIGVLLLVFFSAGWTAVVYRKGHAGKTDRLE